MRCPECNTEIHDTKSRFCPNCGAPVNNGDSANEREQSRSESFSSANEREQTKGGSHDEPQLGRGMMIFIAVGLVVVIAYGIATYLYHRNDPEYTRTAIEPDSTLADKNTVKFDTLVPDTAKRDSIRRAEKREAEKILNSIRKKPVEKTEDDEDKKSSTEGASSTDNSTTPSSETTTTPSEPAPAPITAPKPRVEQVENE